MSKSKLTTIKHLPLLIVLAIIIVLGILSFFVIYRHNNADSNGQNASTGKNNGTANDAQTATGTTPKGSTPSTDYTPPTDNSNISLTPSVSGDQVIISTKLLGYSDGTCTLTVSNGSKNATQKADVIYAPDYSTCAGFTLQKTDLGSGTWNIELTILSGGKTTSKTISYQISP